MAVRARLLSWTAVLLLGAGALARAQPAGDVTRAQPAVDPDALPPVSPAVLPPVTVPRPVSAPRVSPLRRAAAIGAALVPGAIIHGPGSYLVREPRAGHRLLVAGAIGVGAMIAGGTPIGLTGAHPTVTALGTPVLVTGAGLLAVTWLADLWVAAGGPATVGSPRAPVPWVVEAGATYLRDPFRERGFTRVGAGVVLGRVELGALGLVDVRGDALEVSGDARVRVLGAPATGAVVDDASRLVVRIGVRGRRDDADRLASLVGDLEVLGRLDLGRLEARLAGTFAELSTGVGVERVAYDAGPHDLGSLMLGGFAWGAYLGRRGEAALFYQHRRDHLAGGLSAGRAAGFLGSFGARADVRIAGPWAVRAGLEVGSGWVTTLALAYQGGPR